MRYFLVILIWLLFYVITVQAQTPIDHWEMYVEAGDLWRYFPGTEEPPVDWKNILFDDVSWSVGPGGIGYGDGDDATIISPVISLYMRQAFTIADPADLLGALFYIDYDDAFVAYLNGFETARGNIGMSGWIPPYNAFADTDTHEAQLYQGGEPEHFTITPAFLASLLIPGENVLAIQIHNSSVTSSDMSAIPWLFCATKDTINNTPALPVWFDEDHFGFTSHLPIMAINTFGQQIPDDPRIIANLKVYDNQDGQLNSTFDEPNGYNGQISIETRGNSSQMFPKKSYGFETQLGNGENNNVELLGFPEENDWILYGPYSDKSLIRNVLVMQLAREMGWYASRTAFCELLINDEYRGLYILMEKIKRDKNRVDINRLDMDDNAGDSITGGYIVKLDWPDDGVSYDWKSPVTWFGGTSQNLNYQYEYPDREDMSWPQKLHIRDYVSSFEQALVGSNFMDIQTGYRKYIDVHSFVDYFILNEVSNNVDAYRLSNYFTKVRNSKGGKLFEGPVWDFNLGFGNANYGNAWQTWGWALNNPYVADVIPFHLKRLRQDPAFADLLRCRWNTLRTSTLSETHIHSIIDSLSVYLGPAIARNFDRWDILGQYVWPNYFVGETHEAEIDYLKGFIGSRLQWMDANLPGNGNNCQSVYKNKMVVSEINYQAFNDFEAGDWFELYNNGTSSINLTGWVVKDENNLNTFNLPAGITIQPGHYLVVCSDLEKFTFTFPDVVNVSGPLNWKLGQKDRLRVYDANGLIVCDIQYTDDYPWPLLSEDSGETLELDDPYADLNDPANWYAGCPGGSPGTGYVFPCPLLQVAEQEMGSISIFPNPAREILNIRVDGHSNLNLTLIAIDGKIIKQLPSVGGLVQFDISDVDAGFYLVKVTGDHGTWVRSVVVL